DSFRRCAIEQSRLRNLTSFRDFLATVSHFRLSICPDNFQIHCPRKKLLSQVVVRLSLENGNEHAIVKKERKAVHPEYL
ncbi:hypothetical protein PENTCL1PPCAC_16310, partial [Pristionchus entomophagus]